MRRRKFRGAGDEDGVERVWCVIVLHKTTLRLAPPVHIYRDYNVAYAAEQRIKRKMVTIDHKPIITKLSEAIVHLDEE